MSSVWSIVTPFQAEPVASATCPARFVGDRQAVFLGVRMRAIPPNADFAVEYEGSSICPQKGYSPCLVGQLPT